MRFLVDHQLPPALAVALRECGHDVAHLYDLSLHKLSDEAIWHRVGLEGAVLITKTMISSISPAITSRQPGCSGYGSATVAMPCCCLLFFPPSMN